MMLLACDEAGHTGPDLLARDQRFFAFASVNIADDEAWALIAEARQQDLRHFNPADLPDADVLVGGPPCVQFSTSKSNTTRNVLDGLELVQSFLRAVHQKKPKYWIMENAPAIMNYLPQEIPLAWLGINERGCLEVPNRGVFVAADYGAAQLRKRYLIGCFPDPVASHRDHAADDLFTERSNLPAWRTFRQALDSLPNPLAKTGVPVEDFNYKFSIPESGLTDHFYDARLTKNEHRGIRKDKERHPFYGVLPFPDPVDRPARTVVATQLGRETLVIKDIDGEGEFFRRATVRECAVLQTFPITFQFFGNSYSTRYRLVGDAVPPVLSFAIGQEIRCLEGLERLHEPEVQEVPLILAPNLGERLKQANGKERKKPANRRFCEMVPGKEQRGCRAEFLNFFPAAEKIHGTSGHVLWKARLHVGEGKNHRFEDIEFATAVREFHASARQSLGARKARFGGNSRVGSRENAKRSRTAGCLG